MTFDLTTLHRRQAIAEDTYEPDRTVGRPSFRPFIVATRPLTGAWPYEASKVIEKAREGYDAGTHMMCQGRDNRACCIILYSWKRKHPVEPMNYFFEEEQ